MKNKILVIGSLNMDLVIRVARHPKPGETLLGGVYQTFPGGKGANQAVAAARLGGKVEMVGRVGNDSFGQALLDSAARDGVGTGYIRKDPEAASGVALITLDAAGQNTIVVASGANARVGMEDLNAASSIFDEAAVLVLQFEIPMPVVEAAVVMAKQKGVKVVLNPAPAAPLSPAVLKQVDYLIPNQSELALLSGQEDLEAGITAMQETGVETVVVTLGGDGLVMASGSTRLQLPSHKVQVVDTVAAGDAFVGGFSVALAEGQPPHKAVEWGNAAGALAVTRAGAQPSLPYRYELEKFLYETR